MAGLFLATIVAIGFAAYFLKRVLLGQNKAAPLPPGPRGLPLVGNLTDLPPPGTPEYFHWLKHKDIYGPISSVTVLGQTLIILNDKDVAFELMDKQAGTYSGRPKMKFAEMCGWGHITAMTPYGKQNRLHRKYIHQQLGTANLVSSFYPLIEGETGRFLWRVSRDSDNLVRHLKTEAAAAILKMTYDYTIEPHKQDPLVKVVDEALEQFSEAAVPGKWIVDVMPRLESLPGWLPGVQFKETATLWKKTTTAMVEEPYAYVKQRMASRSNDVSYVSKMLEQYDSDPSPEDEHAIKWTAATLYGAGADTSVSTLTSFFLAMSAYPEVQRKAQHEIDRVVGKRLPTFSDRGNLPYVNAIVSEILRWLPVAPLGIPHAADEEGMFKGYCIPKGAVLLPNVWWFTHDPATYHEPMHFKPERYFAPYNEPPPDNVIWGFGRRICSGRVFADASIYLTCVQSLAVLNVSKAVDELGNEIEPKIGLQGGAIGRPTPFSCRIRFKSKDHEELVRRAVGSFASAN
ncbi:cytochrome P450 monooxygenase [Lophiotrema nucula]|uniref:Cytochrome P450 monooxygenase n=1 Tax=Lophiotrema nucula TaxID=690887 RepID=A0A6A5ZIB0_9PLEO|nr:cytochrome P450 monooxygenase [Lophiotrema nucula]